MSITDTIKIALGLKNPDGVDEAKLAALRSIGTINRRAYDLQQQAEAQKVAEGNVGLMGKVAALNSEADPTPGEATTLGYGIGPVEPGAPSAPPPSVNISDFGIDPKNAPFMDAITKGLRSSRNLKEQDAHDLAQSQVGSRQTATDLGKARVDLTHAQTRKTDLWRPSAGSAPDAPLTPDEIAVAAYAAKYNGGNVPTALRTNKTAVTQILNAIPALTPQKEAEIKARGLDLPSNAAKYLANSRSLAQQTKAGDMLNASEGLVNRNLDVLEQTLDHVIETGSVPTNALARDAAQALGDDAQAQYRAAYGVVRPEIARILSAGPSGAGGSVLSDTARRELESYTPENATVEQTRSILRIIRKDLANRAAAQKATTEGVAGRIGGVGMPTTAPDSGPALGPDEKVFPGKGVYKKVPGGWAFVRPE